MFDNKFIITLITLIIGVIAICNFNKKDDQITEDFGLLHFKAAREPMLYDPSNKSFVATPNFQNMLSPRFGNVDYGAQINYNQPKKANLAVPDDPLETGNACGFRQNVENFVPPTCSQNSANISSTDYVSENYSDSFPVVSDSFPVGTMEVPGPDGDSQNVVVFNRLMTANLNSRLMGQGDPIRGDLVVCCADCKDSAWVPSASRNPQNCLQQGAMNVMGGLHNETAQKMSVLQNNTVGYDISGGVNISQSELTSLGAMNANLAISAFP